MAELEIHLTVDRGTAPVEAYAASSLGKLLRLTAAGESLPLQLSWRVDGTRRHAELQAAAHRQFLSAVGVGVLRTKVEARLSAEHAVPPLYCEAHVRVATSLARVPELDALASAYRARLSSRARRAADSCEERFVNLRVASTSQAHRFDELVAAIAQAGFAVLDDHREAVLVDTNLAIDSGWLPIEEDALHA